MTYKLVPGPGPGGQWQVTWVGLGWVVLSVYELTPPLEIVYWAPPVRFGTNDLTSGRVVPIKNFPHSWVRLLIQAFLCYLLKCVESTPIGPHKRLKCVSTPIGQHWIEAVREMFSFGGFAEWYQQMALIAAVWKVISPTSKGSHQLNKNGILWIKFIKPYFFSQNLKRPLFTVFCWQDPMNCASVGTKNLGNTGVWTRNTKNTIVVVKITTYAHFF